MPTKCNANNKDTIILKLCKELAVIDFNVMPTLNIILLEYVNMLLTDII